MLRSKSLIHKAEDGHIVTLPLYRTMNESPTYKKFPDPPEQI